MRRKFRLLILLKRQAKKDETVVFVILNSFEIEYCLKPSSQSLRLNALYATICLGGIIGRISQNALLEPL